MDLIKHTTTAITTTTTNVSTADSLDTDDGETPLHSQLIKPFSSIFPNAKNNHHHQPPSTVVAAYKECLKNHAATIGSHALDGCGEYMTSPSSLKCAVCGCHRNFHRREPINNVYACAPHVMLSLTQGDHHQNHVVATPGTPAAIKIEHPNGRKRFRTRFSQDQKEKMSAFADKMGWKMQRRDDKKVVDFCNEIGIRRGIFKVWIHNNKNTFGKKDKETIISPTTTTAAAATAAGANINGRVVVSSESHEEDVINVNGGDHNNNNSSDDQENVGGDGGHDLQVSTNGSSCSC